MTKSVAIAGDVPALLDVRQVGLLLGCSPRHVVRLAQTGALPKPIALGRLRRWRRSDIEASLKSGAETSPN
jgi:predicted DNA-binding transcriptional regulator AlpA